MRATCLRSPASWRSGWAASTTSPARRPWDSGSAYYPGNVDADAEALNYLGYGAGYPGGGSGQSSDMSRAEGAWDTTFQTAVRKFQANAGLTADGWIGPKTRASLKLAVDRQNAIPSSPGALPAPMPPPGVLPGFLPAPAPQPAPGRAAAPVAPAATASEGLFSKRNLTYGAIGLAVLGLGYYAIKA